VGSHDRGEDPASKRRFFDITPRFIGATRIRGKVTAEKEKCKMNMKTTKFLAVLAVLAFAFAAFAVAIPAEEQDADVSVALDFKGTVDFSYHVTSQSVTTKTASNSTMKNVIATSDENAGVETTYTVTGFFEYVEIKSNNVFGSNGLGMGADNSSANMIVFNMTIPATATKIWVKTGTGNWTVGTKLSAAGATTEPCCFLAEDGVTKYVGYSIEANANEPLKYAAITFGTNGTDAVYMDDGSTIEKLDTDRTETFSATKTTVVTKNVTIKVEAPTNADAKGMYLPDGKKLFVAPGVTLTINISGTVASNHNAYGIDAEKSADIIGLGDKSKIVINDTTTSASNWTAESSRGSAVSYGIDSWAASSALVIKNIIIEINQKAANIASKGSFGITGGASGSIKITSSVVTINSSNRAFQAEAALTIDGNSNVIANGGEKGIIVKGALTVGTDNDDTDKSKLSAGLFNPAGFNGGKNDRWGIRTAANAVTIYAGATIESEGLFLRGADATVSGTLSIKASEYAGYYDYEAGTTTIKGTFAPAGLVSGVYDADKDYLTGFTDVEVTVKSTGKVIVAEGAYILGNIKDDTGASEVLFGTLNTTTHYATGILVSSEATITHGSVVIDGDFTESTDGSITINSGEAKISGELNVPLVFKEGGGAKLYVEGGKTLTIGENGSINTTNGTFTVNQGGTLEVAGTMTGTVANNGEIDLLTGGDISAVTINNSETGKLVDETDDDDMKELIIGGDSEGKDTVYSAKQKVIVSSELGYWNLNKGSDITIKGVLVIPEGTVMNVQADAKLIIDNEAKVYVYGTLVIDAKDVSNTNAGILDLKTGFVSVEGSVTLNGTLAMSKSESKFTEIDVEDGGVFIIGENGVVTDVAGSEFYVAEGGDLTVYGTMGSIIYNSGEITIDSDVAVTTATKIVMWTPGAVVDVESYTIKATAADIAKLTISDKGLIFTTFRYNSEDVDVTLTGSEDSVVVSMTMTDATADYSITFSGLEVVAGYTTSATTGSADPVADAAKGIYNGKQYSKNLDISGTFYVDYTYTGTTTGTDKDVSAKVETSTEAVTLASYCAVIVSDEIVINDYVTLNNAAGKLTVTGSIDTVSKDAKVTNAASIIVSGAGAITSIVNTINSETGIDAAKFMTVAQDSTGKTYKIYNYYSIDGALAVVAAAPVTSEIIILGTGQTVTVSAELPEGISLIMINADAKLSVKKGVTFTISDGATVKGEGTIAVNGTMYAEEKTDVKSTVTVISDVKTEQLDEKGKATKNGWALWTNLADALAAAEPGSVVTITKTDDVVNITTNMTIPDAVTLAIPAGTVGILLKNGVTLTINGTVLVGSNIYAQQAFGLDAQNIKGVTGDNKSRQSSAIVVNGALISATAIEYGNGYAAVNTQTANAKKIALIGGTYADGEKYITVETAEPASVAGSVKAPIAGAYYTIKDGTATYRVISSLEVAAENIDVITSDITIHGDVSGLILTFAKTDDFDEIIVAADNVTAPTSIETGNNVTTELTAATLALDEVKLTVNSYFTGIVGNGANALTFADAKAVTVLDKSDKLYVYGTVIANTAGAYAGVSAGTVYLGYDATAFEFTGGNNYLVVSDDAIALVENGGNISKLRVEGGFGVPANKAVIVGTLVDLGEVEVAATTESSAKGTLTINSLFVGVDAAPKDAKTFATASIGGPIAVTATANAAGIAYIMGDAEVGLDTAVCLATLKNTTFFIDDEEFYTMFSTAVDTALDDYKPLIPEAKITGWVDEDGNPVTITGTTYVGANDALYAVIDYNLYSVTIVTDAGVKSVAINGIELVNDKTNVFELKAPGLVPLKTGTYKVTYTLKSGYQEDKNGVNLYTNDGTVLVNHSFVASGASDYSTIYLQLNGTEIIPEPEPVTPEEQSEWTITTILLCVLVVLIAIMAVIVALRLNRN